MTIIDEYLEYTKKYSKSHGEKTLVLIQVGSFYESYAIMKEDGSYYGSKIQEFANINDMIISKKNVFVDKRPVVMAGFGLPQLEKYVKKMTQNGYTIVVYSQDSVIKTTRFLDCIYSPGTFFNNNDTNENGLSNNTICIWIHYSKANSIVKEDRITIGLSLIDIITGKLINYEYTHQYIDSPTTYDQLEKYIAIYNPAEVIIITNKEDKNFIDTVISYANINARKFHKITLKDIPDKNKTDFEKIATNCEKQKFQETLIDKIYGIGSYKEKSEFFEYSIANQSLCFLLDFVERHNSYLIKNIELPIFENHADKLVLANHSLKQLNIISDNRYNGKCSCVLNLLNNCITNSGKRRFNYDLLHPISNIDELQKAYDITEHLIKTDFHSVIRGYLNNIKDIEKFERKLVMKRLDPKDFMMLYHNLSNLSELYKIIYSESQNSQLYNYIKTYIDSDIDVLCDELQKFIKEKFNLEKAGFIVIDKLSNYNIDELDFINKNYNEKLNILLKNCIDSREQFDAIRYYFSQIIAENDKKKVGGIRTKKNKEDDDETELEYVKIHETSKNDAMLISTNRRTSILKECISKIITKKGKIVDIKYDSKYSGKEEILKLDLSLIEYKFHGGNKTNQTIFSKHINEISSSIQNSKDILVDSITKHYNTILNDFLTFNNKIKLSSIARFIALVDLCQSRTYNAIKYNYCKPNIKDNGDQKAYVNCKKIRHCLIEQLNNNEIYVSNDIELGNDINGALLYGVNAVGKSSFIKSIGIAIILAQSGMYVPCSDFTYYPYSFLFTRILGNDNIFKGLSTFAVEMCELRTILKLANQNSLIIGDEVCSGTESNSAHSIFSVCLENLHSIKSSFIFATHFQEILEFDEVKNLDKLKVYHMSVQYDRTKNKLIYDRKLKNGSGDILYGLEVAKSLDLPDNFIERAYEIRNKYSNSNNTTLDSKGTSYNAKKIKNKICEICNINQAVDTHHLQFQEHANKNGFINEQFNKNHKANLISICEICHNKIHKQNKQLKKIKTSQGYDLVEI